MKLKAAYDGSSVYLLALWNDDSLSRNRYWKRTGQVEFARHAQEDGFAVLWSPGSDRDAFAEQGCALYCHGDSHAIPDAARARFVDMWYWGAQQTQPFTKLRDMALRGGADRLRGDTQPEHSDNVYNHSAEFEGPRWYPLFVNKGAGRLLMAKNLTEVKRSTLTDKIPNARGREIPLDVLRERGGSRGDVKAKARFYKSTDKRGPAAGSSRCRAPSGPAMPTTSHSTSIRSCRFGSRSRSTRTPHPVATTVRGRSNSSSNRPRTASRDDGLYTR